jgi:hypothetical protein
MATCEPTKWVILGNGVRTDLVPGGGGLVAQLRLLTTGPTDAVIVRADELGSADAKQRLYERMADDAKVEHYRRLRAEGDGIAQQVHGLQATAGRLYAERAELLAHAAPGFAAKVAALDKRAADVEAKVAQAKSEAEAIRTTLGKARQDALAVIQRTAADVQARIGWELGQLREVAVEQLAKVLSPLLTEFAATERALLTASGASLVGDLGRLLEELAAAANVTEGAA